MTSRQTILILGAGIAGLRCALDLADRVGQRDDVSITLVNKTLYHTLHSTLYEAVTAEDMSSILCLPLQKLIGKRPIHFIHDRVSRIDPIHQKVSLDRSGTIRYDYLVLALGNTPATAAIPGLAEHGRVLNSFEDALSLRATIRELLMVQKKLNVVIGGGGAVGSELAGALSYFSHELCNDCDKCEKHLEISLIEQSGRLLPGEKTRLAKAMEQKLHKLNVDVYFGKRIKRVTKNTVVLENNYTLPYDLFIWAGGGQSSKLLQEVGFDTDQVGRVIVAPTLQARGFSRIYAIGDTAHFSLSKKQALTASIAYATSQGALAAKNIINQINEKPQVSYQPPWNPRAYNFGNYAALLPLHGWMIDGSLGLLLKRFLVFDYLLNILPLTQALASRSRRGIQLAYRRLTH